MTEIKTLTVYEENTSRVFTGIFRWEDAYQHYLPEQFHSEDRLLYWWDIVITVVGYFWENDLEFEDSEGIGSICEYCEKLLFSMNDATECQCPHCPVCGVFNQPDDCEGGCQNCGTKYDFVTGERL